MAVCSIIIIVKIHRKVVRTAKMADIAVATKKMFELTKLHGILGYMAAYAVASKQPH